MRLGCWLGKPNQIRPLRPVYEAAAGRGWTVRWMGPGSQPDIHPHPRDVPDVLIGVGAPPEVPAPYIWLQGGMDPYFDPKLPGTTATVAVYTDWWQQQLPPVRSVVTGYPILAPRDLVLGRPPLVYVPFSVRSGSPTYLQRLRSEWAHRRFIGELARYIGDGGDPLHVKVRAKDPIPHALERLADRVVDDESGDGDTLDWLAGAKGCLHVYSSVVLEAAALGIPSLCFDPGAHAFRPEAQRFCNGHLGGLFNWPGVVELRQLSMPFSPLPKWTLSADALRRYREQYVSAYPHEEAAQNVCDLAKRMA